jgi:hypothetical protein
LLKEQLPKLAGRLLHPRLVDADGKSGTELVRPDVKPDPTSDAIICTWNIAVSFDRDAYYKEAVPMLQSALAAVAEAQPDGLTPVNTPTAVASAPPGKNNGRRVAGRIAGDQGIGGGTASS